MSIRQPIVVALCAGVWAVAGSARAGIHPLPLEPGWQSAIRAGWPAADAGPAAEPRRELLAQWAGLPPEQRQQMRQQMREHWQQMPPEQRVERRQDYRERWQQMPSEERQRLREDVRERGGGYGGHRGRGDRR